MTFKKDELIEDLTTRTNNLIAKLDDFSQLPINALNHKSSDSQWSALECIDHLVRYGAFYNPAIAKSINESVSKPNEKFKSGVIGNYFVKSMLPKDKLNKMKTFKDKDPSGSDIDKDIIFLFKTQQLAFLELLEKAKKTDLQKAKTPITISKIVRLRLGDTLRFSMAHNERHMLQAEKAIAFFR